MKCFTFFIVLILLYSCKSRIKNTENEEIMDYIFSLQSSIDSLYQNVDSLNDRLLKLEGSATNQELVTEMNPEGPKIGGKITCPTCEGVGTTRETCGKCRGSGWEPKDRGYGCLGCGGNWGSTRQAKGYVISTCSNCHGNRRINEFE